MPVHVKKQGNKWRVLGPDGRPETQDGSPVDGGGHESREKAMDQAMAINTNERKRKD